MSRFRKKPVVIDAIQWTGTNLLELAREFPEMDYSHLSEGLKIFTLEGAHVASTGDWIIKGIKGEYYPCKPDIFEATYDRVEKPMDAPGLGLGVRTKP